MAFGVVFVNENSLAVAVYLYVIIVFMETKTLIKLLESSQ